MARPREFDPDAAVRAALKAFWVRGYEATSTTDLVDATGLSRSSLYATFGSKHGLFLRTLDHYLADGGASSPLGPLLGEGADLAAIEAFFGRFADEGWDDTTWATRGCYCVTTAVELAARDPEVAARARVYRAGMHRAMTAALATAARRGDLRDGVDLERAATTLTTLAVGLLASLRMGADAAEARGVHDAATTYLASLRA